MEELKHQKYWEYRPEWCAWWLMLADSDITSQRGFGPFNATEAQWAADIHGVPFPPATEDSPQ